MISAVRAKFALSAQIVVRCIAKVADAYKIDNKTKRSFRPHGAISYDSRVLSYNLEKSRVSIWTLGGRQAIPFVCNERQRELLARVKARLRMTRLIREQGDGKQLEPVEDRELRVFDNLTIDEMHREISLDGTSIPYKPKEYELMLFLAKHVGRMVSREFLLSEVWGYDYLGDSRTIDVHIRWLREKIEKDPSNPTRIITVRGGGYRFEG